MTATAALTRLGPQHRALLHEFRDHAEQWLAGKGLEQYNGVLAANARADIDRLLERGEFFGLVEGEQVRAVAALTTPDMDFWTPAEARDTAAYLARFMVSEHRKQYGEHLLAGLVEHLRSARVPLLRLDCWRDNEALHAYYVQNGFHHVRTVEVEGRMSGALFERSI